MLPSSSDNVLCEIFKCCNECIDSNNSTVIQKKLEKKTIIQIPIFIIKFHNSPGVKWLIELFAIEIEVKFGQNLNGSFIICSIELLSKLMEINIVVAVDFNELQSTLKINIKELF